MTTSVQVRQRTAVIAGGGIGGLAAGIALLKRGWSVDVYEQSDDIRVVGAGIYIWENGLKVLEALGVFDQVVAEAVQISRRERRDADGSLFGAETTSLSGRLFVPLRRALLTALRDGVLGNGGRINFGKRAVGADAAGVLHFADGSAKEADLVIGADGINSPVRDSLGLLRYRRPANQYGYRSMIPREPGDAAHETRGMICEHWNGSRRLLYAPSTSALAYTQLTSLRGDEAAGAPFGRASWLRTFPHLEWIIGRIPEDGKGDWFEKIRLRKWSKGRVAIVGDAASAQPPFLGQGGGVAMTSALSLAHALDRHEDTIDGLADWERDERRFVEWVQSVSGWYGELARLPAAWRRTALRTVGGNEWLRRRTIRCAAIRPLRSERPEAA